MSETITIREVDQQKTLSNVDKLKTNKQGGGYVYWVPESEVQTTTKHITKNGTYKAKDDDKYAYSEVTVNVRGGNGSADSHGNPSGGDIKPGGAGSAVVGEDEDGNEAVVGVDEQGKLVKTPIPSAIKIITPPTRTSYTAGESMDYTGIVVGLRNKDGSTFTNATYPNGHIPMGELVFPVIEAPTGGPGGKTSPVDTSPISKPITYNDVVSVTEKINFTSYINTISHEIVATNGTKVLVTNGGGYYYVYAVSATEVPSVTTTRNIHNGRTGEERTETNWRGTSTAGTSPLSYTYNGQAVYWREIDNFVNPDSYPDDELTGNPGNVLNNGENVGFVRSALGPAAWTAVYGTDVGGVSVPVRWTRNSTGDTLEDNFQISVRNSNSANGSGGGGSF